MGGKRSIEEFTRRMVTPDDLRAYEEQGVYRLVLGVPVSDLDFFQRALDAVAACRTTAGVWALASGVSGVWRLGGSGDRGHVGPDPVPVGRQPGEGDQLDPRGGRPS